MFPSSLVLGKHCVTLAFISELAQSPWKNIKEKYCFQSRMNITAEEKIFYVKQNFPLSQKLMIYSQVYSLLFSVLLHDSWSADAVKVNCCTLSEELSACIDVYIELSLFVKQDLYVPLSSYLCVSVPISHPFRETAAFVLSLYLCITAQLLKKHMRFMKHHFRRCSKQRRDYTSHCFQRGLWKSRLQLAKKTKLLDRAPCNSGRRRDPIPSSAAHLPLLPEKQRRHGASHGIKELEEQHRTGIASN